MGNFAVYSSLMGLAIGLILVGCQSQPVTLSESDEPTQAVEHAMGTSQVPVEPQRVVMLDTTPLDAALAVGIEPVGTIRYGAPPEYLGEVAADIPVIGQFNQPNLETILELDPDLILGAKSISEAIYPQLTQIAPTVFIQGAGRDWDWKDNFRLFAEALGRPEQAEQRLAEYQQQLEDLQAAIATPAEDVTVSILVSTPRGLIAHTPTSFSGSILEEVGFSRNSIQSSTEQFFVRFSREELNDPDGDVIFLIHNPEWESESKAEFTADPLWSQLGAVKADAVCEVAGEVWGSGRSILAAQRVLQDVEQCLQQVNLKAGT
ncbi:MAG: iron-siderophore ABC transporter substrate-binding protein [Cyanobacteria bacterium P01_H01_bin.119]